MPKDKDYIHLIHSARWLRLRCEKLSAQPLCERCKAEGIITPAVEVHHVHPVEMALSYADKDRLMFDIHNLLSLCHDCHVKTHIEMGRSGKAATARINAQRLADFRRRYLSDLDR